ncbi:hypothetical protein [Streptomyces sp. H72]
MSPAERAKFDGQPVGRLVKGRRARAEPAATAGRIPETALTDLDDILDAVDERLESRNASVDRIAREGSTGKLWFYPGTSTGGVGACGLNGSGGWNVMESILAVGDFNADGRNDLAGITPSSYVGEGSRGVDCLVLFAGQGTGVL